MVTATRRGKLTIYLGYAPGVGKTYRMLSDARYLHEHGSHVVIGHMAHGRTAIDAQKKSLEELPYRAINYRGIAMTEMDTDAIIARYPSLVLIDELAHTNVPGSKYEKRYQDVAEILDAGIPVATTLNIQHIESIAKKVEIMLGMRVRERVPEQVIADADRIIVVDLDVAHLIDRIRTGKVYCSRHQAQVDMEHFFKEKNLTWLRKMTFLEAASLLEYHR